MKLLFSVFVMGILAFPPYLPACTNIIVTKGASADGSVMLAYTNDGEWLYRLSLTPGKTHAPGDSIRFSSSRNKTAGSIAQPSVTYSVVGFQMNEHQVAIGETTFTGREELWNTSGFVEYWHLMQLALERATTAREAIGVMTGIVEQYGYGSEGESFSIIDPHEAWILEMIGTGTSGEGAIWVAVKIPDGYISAHANMARIGEFPLDDPENCLYSENVISFAIERGYFDPDAGKPFCFNEVYNPPSPDRLKYCETRVWSIFRRAAPQLKLSPDYHRGVEHAERYPLWIKPDAKLSLADVFSLLRDHYEGTPYDMTKGIDAGPFGNPNRHRPLYWEEENVKYSWERPISTFNTAFSYVAQARSWLPPDIGGIAWFGVDDTWFTCYFPVFIGVDSLPAPFTTGDINKFSWDSAWWVFNFVSNYANQRYSDMIGDIISVQTELETQFIAGQDSVSQIALHLNNPERRSFLTNYTVTAGETVHRRWISLAEHLITKYNDGYIKDESGRIREEGYPGHWREAVISSEPEKFRIPAWKEEGTIEVLPY